MSPRLPLPTAAFAVALAAAVAVAAGPAGPAAARPARPGPVAGRSAASAFDPTVQSPETVSGGDDSDLVVGVPSAVVAGHVGAGIVDVHYDPRPSAGDPVHPADQRLSEASFGLPGGTGDGFGASTAILQTDAGPMVVIGAPGADGGAGRVVLVKGSADGIVSTAVITVPRETAGPGARFGARVVADYPDFWVTAPNDSTDGHAEAGAIYHYTVSADGTGVSFVQRVDEATPGVSGIPETDDHFGYALAVDQGGSGAVVIGEPYEDVGRVRDAGTVTVLRMNGTTNQVYQAQTLSQNTPGVGGTAEAGDHFGASVSQVYELFAVGVPGESIGTRAKAGMVQFFDTDYPFTQRYLGAVDQDAPDVGGTSETGDEFGASIEYGGFSGTDLDLAVGVPGEDLGSVRDAGLVQVFTQGYYVDPHFPTELREFARGTGGSNDLGGRPTASDRVGAALSALAFTPTYVGCPFEDGAEYTDGGAWLAVAIPGDDAGATDAGSVTVGSGTTRLTVRDSGGPAAGEQYGASISTFATAPFESVIECD